MAVTLTGYAGYFTRQGAIIGEFNRVTDTYASALTTGFESVWVQFASSDQAAVQDLPQAVASYRQQAQTYQTTVSADGQKASLLQVSDDTSVVPYTFGQSVLVLAAQMESASATVNRPTIGAVVTPAGTNLGDTVVAASTVNAFGDPLDMVMAETVTVTCTNSSQNYAETLAVVGAPAVAGTSYLWPAGSGANTSLVVLNPAANGIVTDGDFEEWEGTGNNTPTYWDIANGTAGTQVVRSTNAARGTYCAQIVGDGSSATQLYQDVTLAINTVYMFTFQAKINTVTATGTFRVALTDTSGNVLADDAGTSLSYTRNLNGQITTSYQTFTAFFATPRQLPVAGQQIRIGLSVAATSGRLIDVDLVGIVAATPAYQGGPYLAAVSGADATAFGDSWAVAVTNSLTARSFVRGMDRLYNMRQLGVYFPSSTSPTISDSLVTH